MKKKKSRAKGTDYISAARSTARSSEKNTGAAARIRDLGSADTRGSKDLRENVRRKDGSSSEGIESMPRNFRGEEVQSLGLGKQARTAWMFKKKGWQKEPYKRGGSGRVSGD